MKSTIKNYDVAIVKIIRFIGVILASQLISYAVIFMLWFLDGFIMVPAEYMYRVYGPYPDPAVVDNYWVITILSILLIIRFGFNSSILKSFTIQKWLKVKLWFSSLNNDYDLHDTGSVLEHKVGKKKKNWKGEDIN